MADDPVAIVTGAGSGIGRATCRQLAQLSYRLAVVGRRAEPLHETLAETFGSGEASTRGLVIPADVSEASQCKEIVRRTDERWQRIDLLVNNAGSVERMHMRDLTPDAVSRLFAVNLFGPMYLIAAVWPVMARDGGGVIVNVSSMSAGDPFPGLGVYGAAKAGLEGITRAIANEGGSIGLRAYAIAPGAVETSMLRGLFSPESLPTSRTLDPEQVAEIIVRCALGQSDEPSGATLRLPSPP